MLEAGSQEIARTRDREHQHLVDVAASHQELTRHVARAAAEVLPLIVEVVARALLLQDLHEADRAGSRHRLGIKIALGLDVAPDDLRVEPVARSRHLDAVVVAHRRLLVVHDHAAVESIIAVLDRELGGRHHLLLEVGVAHGPAKREEHCEEEHVVQADLPDVHGRSPSPWGWHQISN